MKLNPEKGSPQSLHWEIRAGIPSQFSLRSKSFCLFLRRCCLLYIFLCIKYSFKPNSGPRVKMPVFAMGLTSFFQMIYSRGEEFKAVQNQCLLFIEGFWPDDVWSIHNHSPLGSLTEGLLLLTFFLAWCPLSQSMIWEVYCTINSGSGSVSEKYSNAGLRDDEWSFIWGEGRPWVLSLGVSIWALRMALSLHKPFKY